MDGGSGTNQANHDRSRISIAIGHVSLEIASHDHYSWSLSAMDIEPDDRDRFGQAILIKQHVSWQRRQQTLAEARRYWNVA